MLRESPFDVPSTRRAFLTSAAAGAAALGLVACGGDSGGGGGAGTSATTAAGTFPLDVRHQHGTTTITEAPERVVSYGYGDQDVMLALGVVPQMVMQWIPDWKRGVGPWGEEALGAAEPVIIPATDEVAFEKIAATRPDLIVAVNFELARGDYDKLSQLAPTVPQPTGFPPYGVPWDAAAVQIGTALGRRAEAEQLVRDTEQLFVTARDENPSFAGKTALMIAGGEGGEFSVYAPTDTRGRFLEALGFEYPAGMAKELGEEFYTLISAERLDLLDEADVLVAFATDGVTRQALRELKPFQALDVVKEGRLALVDDVQLMMALTSSTILAIPYAVEHLVPKLRDVVPA